MAIATFLTPTDMRHVSGFVRTVPQTLTPTAIFNGDGLNRAIFGGTFTFDSGNREITGGTLTSITRTSGPDTLFTITGLNVPVLAVRSLIVDNDLQTLVNTLLTGNDVIVGSTGNDTLVGTGPDTSLAGNGGTDVLSGGAGTQTAVVALARNQAKVVLAGTDGTVTGPGLADTLTSIERIRFIDGTLAYGADTAEAQAARLYQAAFGRAADANGLGFWSGLLQTGTSLLSIAGEFVASAEFTARYGSLDTAGFVDALYRNVLGRPADTVGSAFWSGVLDRGVANRAQVLVSFSEGPENRQRTASLVGTGLWVPDANAASVARLYYATLGRAPDAAGLDFWTTRIEGGTATLQQEAAAFVSSAEFTGRYGGLGDTGFVDLLYRNVLGRGADPAGLDYWTGQLAGGESRTGVVIAFSESGELKTRLFPVIEQNGVVLG